MSPDPDLIRCDLLKIKRKIFLSFPEGSVERQNFILSSKLSELDYLSGLIPSSTSNSVFAEYEKSLVSELKYIFWGLGCGLCLSFILFLLHRLYPDNMFLIFFSVPFCMSALFSISPFLCMIDQWRKMKPFKKELHELQNRILKLSKEIRDIK